MLARNGPLRRSVESEAARINNWIFSAVPTDPPRRSQAPYMPLRVPRSLHAE
jgi:hypothetical protein